MYIFDDDLEFLREIDNDDLTILIEILIGKENDRRLTQDLTINENFKKYYPDHKKYINLIFEEIQRFGGNTFANIMRGSGVLYKEILFDVCDKMKVNYNKKQSIILMEQSLFFKILEESIEKMSEEELKNLS